MISLGLRAYNAMQRMKHIEPSSHEFSNNQDWAVIHTPLYTLTYSDLQSLVAYLPKLFWPPLLRLRSSVYQ